MTILPSDIGAHRFGHQAMNTEWEIFCVHADRDYAQQACWAAFDLLDRMERELSRFIENSDISRINSLMPGETVRVNRWTAECIRMAQAAFAETAGAFDISLGTGLESLRVSPHDNIVQATVAGVRIDLGGIGKGYAVDRLAEVMIEWDISQALIHGGHSSVLAMDPPPGLAGWPLTLGGRAVNARRQVFSASGTLKGDHILDPRTGKAARLRQAAWVSAEWTGESPAAEVEVYSTAFMVLPADEVKRICASRPGLHAWLAEDNEFKETSCVQH